MASSTTGEIGFRVPQLDQIDYFSNRGFLQIASMLTSLALICETGCAAQAFVLSSVRHTKIGCRLPFVAVDARSTPSFKLVDGRVA